MNVADELLKRIKSKQHEFALESLSKPQNRDAFEYGHRVGFIGGLNEALNVLYSLLDEEKNSGNDL